MCWGFVHWWVNIVMQMDNVRIVLGDVELMGISPRFQIKFDSTFRLSFINIKKNCDIHYFRLKRK